MQSTPRAHQSRPDDQAQTHTPVKVYLVWPEQRLNCSGRRKKSDAAAYTPAAASSHSNAATAVARLHVNALPLHALVLSDSRWVSLARVVPAAAYNAPMRTTHPCCRSTRLPPR